MGLVALLFIVIVFGGIWAISQGIITLGTLLVAVVIALIAGLIIIAMS